MAIEGLSIYPRSPVEDGGTVFFLGRQVSDGDLRKILRQLAPQKREINITIKK